MAGRLPHSPADIVRQMLVDLGLGTYPVIPPNAWPMYVGLEPDLPDNCITLYDTTGIHQGRTHFDGEVQERHAIQVRVRSTKHKDGWNKINEITIAMDQDVYGETVTLIDPPAVYRVHAISRTSPPIPLGKQVPTSKRSLFTVNATLTVRATSTGFGAATTGGAGRPVYYVTNLNVSGAGSLRQALSDATASSGGIVKFDKPGEEVGGVIDLSASSALTIPSNTTIAGETALVTTTPPGITVYGAETGIVSANNVIVRHIRFRDQDRDRPSELDPLSIDTLKIHDSTNIVISHCSLSWGNDGTLDISESDLITIEYCIVAETLEPHAYASLVYGPVDAFGNVTLHHNLYISHRQRSARFFNGGKTNGEFYNNVVYNWGTHGTQVFGDPSQANIIGNWYEPGPSTTNPESAIHNSSGGTAYEDDNHFEGSAAASGTFEEGKVEPVSGMTPTSAIAAFTAVMANAGAFPRDEIDDRLIDEVTNGTGSIKSAPLVQDLTYLGV